VEELQLQSFPNSSTMEAGVELQKYYDELSKKRKK
jgi:hypothetical protein